MKLTAFEMHWLLAILATIYPSNAHPRLKTGAADTPVQHFFADVFATAPWLPLLGIRAAIWVITFCPLLVIGRVSRFHKLPEPDRLRVIETLGHSNLYPVREMPMLIKTIGGMGFASMPEVQKQIGVDVAVDIPAWAQRSEVRS